jgi:apolipoprotein D and lipocalin family protein
VTNNGSTAVFAEAHFSGEILPVKSLFVWALAGLLASAAHADETASARAAAVAESPLRTIVALDVPRYMGTWYEIAKYPNRFQRKCISNTRAEYTSQADGSVQVLNRCTREDGGVDEALGQARQVGDSRSPKLEVRFAPAWLSFLPWVWGNYWVVDLDPEYQLAAVGEPTREYLWILARTPTVNARAYEELLVRLEKQGYDSRKIQITPQKVQ